VSATRDAAADIVAAWSERVRQAASGGAALRIVGGGTKDFYGQELVGELFPTRAYAGIVDHDPTELVITARCGTPLDEIEDTLARAGQMLGFEPPRFGPASTIGGCVVSGLSGPRRPYAGAVRDHLLGVRLLDGRGEDLVFGGRVMKNVAGFDVSRLIAGSLGTLGIVLEASLRCLPRPRVEATRVLELDYAAALRRMNEWGAQPLPVTATWYSDSKLHVRLSGAESAVAAAARVIGGTALDDAETLWASIRDQTHGFFAAARSASLWRLSVPPTAPHAELPGVQAIEWRGALRWIRIDAGVDARPVRAWATQHGGHATVFRGEKSAGAFQPLDAPLLRIHRALKAAFDPAGIFNRRRLFAEV
jgi:glycolate oxidase FAD binding subunit